MIVHFKDILCIGLLACLLFACTPATNNPEVVYVSDSTAHAINRAALLKMDTGQPITVVGHKSQDPDAVCSAIAMAALLQQLGMDATPYMQEHASRAVKYIFDQFLYPAPAVKTTIEPDMPVVLTDHNDYLQSLIGIEHANIVGVVDHHGISSSLTSAAPLYTKFMPVGATNTIVYSIYKDCGIVPSPEVARIMLAGIIADTDSLTMSTTTGADFAALTELIALTGFAPLSELTQGIFAALDSYDGMTDEEIFMSDIKQYEIAGVHLAVTSLNATEQLPIETLCERMQAVMPTIQQQLGVEMLFAKMDQSYDHPDVLDNEGNPTVTYVTHIAYYGTSAKETAEAAFGPSSHGSCIVLDRKVNRKAEFIPAITKVLEGK